MTQKEIKKYINSENYSKKRIILPLSPAFSEQALKEIIFDSEDSEFVLEVGKRNYNLARFCFNNIDFINIVLNPKLDRDWWVIGRYKSIYSFGNFERIN